MASKNLAEDPYERLANAIILSAVADYRAALKKVKRNPNPFCVKCYEEGHITMATVVDHIVPHRGDQKLFWDRGNWQPLCEHHHNVKTMTEDRYVEYKF